VPVTSVAMKLLDMRLKPSSAIVASVSGEFSAPGMHELVIARTGGTLELHRIVQATDRVGDKEDEDESRTFVKLICRVETKSILRSLTTIRLTGDKRDVVAIGADGGALSVLDFEGGSSKTVHCCTFGKTGCRRSTPGQYVAADPKGRAVMIAAIEKRKLVYVLNRDATGKPTMASPLEAHRARTITFDAVGVDNGYDNPMFATLELQYKEVEDMLADNTSNSGKDDAIQIEKQLAYYELDLGLNHVSRRWATATHRTACCLAAVPGGADGPGGVLVGGEDWIEYFHESMSSQNNSGDNSSLTRIVAAVPRRTLHPPEKGILVTRITVHRQKKSKFFALAQSELGDVYKVTLQLDPSDKTKVTRMTIALLDTLPMANSLNVSKLGMLFVAAQFGDHCLYQFDRIDLPDAPTCNSDQVRDFYAKNDDAIKSPSTFLTTATATQLAPKFHPTVLKNLRTLFSMDNPSPTTGVMVGELAGNEVSPQIYTLTGSGPRSSLRVLRHGASVTELAVSELPGVPGGIFTIADNSSSAATPVSERKDQYIVVSFADATLVLSVGETVEEVGRESGFLTNAPTLACSALGNDGALCQVHPAGVRHIQKGHAKQWHCPGLKRIECASANESQVIIALAGGEVIYFELDPMSGNLTESATRDMGADVCCLDVGTIPQGSSRSFFAAVGCRDQTVRIVSLEPGKWLHQQSSTALKSRPHACVLQRVAGAPSAPSDASGKEASSGMDELALVIGLDDGSSLRATVDLITGSIGTSPSKRFLGARPVAVSRIILESRASTLLLSSRPWISRLDPASGKHIMAPLSYTPLDHGCSFHSDAVREGVVATAGKTLRILSVDTAGIEGGDEEAFNTEKIDLRYTPRQMTLLSAAVGGTENRKILLAVVESDCNDYGLEAKTAMGFDTSGEAVSAKKSSNKANGDSMDMDEGSDDEDSGDKKISEEEGADDEDADEKEARKTPIRGPIPPGPGHWGSCVRLLDPADSCRTLDCLEMNRNEAALCCSSVRFHSKGGEPLLAVGTVSNMMMNPLRQSASHIVLYRVVNGERLQLLHRTTVDDGPVLAMAHFQGRLLVGIGKSLKLYEMGKRQLLRKSELRGLPTYVKTLQTAGDR